MNEELLKYIEENVFPSYEKNDEGHNINHIKYVIDRSLKFANQFDVDINMVYTIAAFHDIGHYIDKDNHEVLSADMFYQNEDMKRFFTDDERLIIKEAIIDHRASLEYEPRSIYGKIVSSADRNISIDSALMRTHSYTVKHFKDLDLNGIIDRAYKHISEKFGTDGYAKVYVIDPDYDNFKQEVAFLLSSKEEFIKRYMKVNNIDSDKCMKKTI